MPSLSPRTYELLEQIAVRDPVRAAELKETMTALAVAWAGMNEAERAEISQVAKDFADVMARCFPISEGVENASR